MRLQVTGITLLTCVAAYAQSMVEPASLDTVRERIDTAALSPRLRCHVTLIRPALTFGLRFQAGFRIEFPMDQFRGIGRDLNLLVRVTPDGGRPAYLKSTAHLPASPQIKVDAGMNGAFIVGEGGYRVETLVEDQANRVCSDQGRIQARRQGSESELKAPTPALTVEALPVSERNVSPATRPDVRVTIFLHAAPVSTDRARLYPEDVAMLTDSLSAILEQLVPGHTRLVVFNLAQDRVLLQKESFALSDLGEVAAILSGLQFGVIDYQTLQNPSRVSDLLSTLLQQELRRAEQPDALIWLGPISDAQTRLQMQRFEKQPPFKSFYLQYRQPLRLGPVHAGPAELRDPGQAASDGLQFGDPSEAEADSIEALLHHIKGDTLIVRNPHDLANAIRHVETYLQDLCRAVTPSGSLPDR